MGELWRRFMESLFMDNLRRRWRERRDPRVLQGDWLVVEVKAWESARRR